MKPWTWVTALFFVIRYGGIYCAIIVSLLGTTYMPGPQKLCAVFFFTEELMYGVFLCSADLLMVLRVYALWKRSKIIVGVLLSFYTTRVILEVIGTSVFGNPYVDTTVVVTQVLDYSYCYPIDNVMGPYMQYWVIYPTIFHALLFILAVIPTLKQSIAAYKASKRWQHNRYMSLITKEGIFYLFLNMVRNIPQLIPEDVNIPSPAWIVIADLFLIVTAFPIIPRFVLNIRELYEKDSRGGFEGIDSGFGIGNVSDTIVSGMVFADGINGLGTKEDDEEAQLEPVGRINGL